MTRFVAISSLVFACACGGGGSSPASPDAAGMPDAAVAPCIGFDVASPTPFLFQPSLAFAGDRYFVMTADQDVLQLAPIIDGVIGSSLTVGATPHMSVSGHAMAWSGSRLGVVYITASGSSDFVVYDSNALEIARTHLPADAYWTRVAWAADHFVLAGQSLTGFNTLALAEVDQDGALISPAFYAGGSYNIGQFGSIAVSPGYYAVSVSGSEDPSVMFVDRATHMYTTQAIDPEGYWAATSVAYRDGVFAATRSGGGLGGDPVQFFDATGVATRRIAMVYGSADVKLFATEFGYSSVATISSAAQKQQMLEIDLDAYGDPLGPPIMPLETATGQTSISLLDAVVSPGRFATSFWADNSLRVIEHCY